jgi:hypothetical protein
VALTRERTVPIDRRLLANLVSTFADRGVAWSAQRIPTVVNLSFLDRFQENNIAKYCDIIYLFMVYWQRWQ